MRVHKFGATGPFAMSYQQKSGYTYDTNTARRGNLALWLDPGHRTALAIDNRNTLFRADSIAITRDEARDPSTRHPDRAGCRQKR